jgi:hypothetical protein
MEDRMPDLKYGEQQLAEYLGIERAVLREAREIALKLETDYDKLKSRILYSGVGVLKMMTHLSILENVDQDVLMREVERLTAETMGTAGKNGVIEAIFVQSWRNPHIVQARVGKDLVRVRVHHKDDWTRGDKIPCRHISGDLYRVEGRRPSRRNRRRGNAERTD